MNKWEAIYLKAIPKGILITTNDGITHSIHDIYGDGTIREVTDPDEATKIVENILEKRLTNSESGV